MMERNTKLYYDSALKLLLPVHPVHDIDGFTLELAGSSYIFSPFNTPFNKGCTNWPLLQNKYETQRHLERFHIPVAHGASIKKEEFEQGNYEHLLSHLRYPLVKKPILDCFGNGVICNIQNKEQLDVQLKKHFIKYSNVLIEEFHSGLNAFRVLVFKKKILGIVKREPAYVIGDGVKNLSQLIELKNIERQQNKLALGPIIIDDEVKIRLEELGIDEQFVPKKNEKIVLAYTCNASRGGEVEAVEPKMCSQNLRMIKKIMDIVDLNLAGVDIQCADLSQPITKSNGIVIEINPEPNIRIHELPMYGTPQPVTTIMMKSFIYRHPLAYLYSLAKHSKQSIYMRIIFILFIIIPFIYFLSLFGKSQL